MFRLFYIALLSILLLQSCGSHSASKDPANQSIPLLKAKEDFRLFREVLDAAHPSLTVYISEKTKNFLFDSVYNSISTNITLRDLFNKLFFITNEIGCSHTSLSMPSFLIDTLYNRNLFFPMPVIMIDGRLWINSNHDLPHGTELLTINDLPVSRILDSLMMYNPVEGIHRETQQYLSCNDFGFDYYVRFGGAKQFKLLIEDTFGIKKIFFVDAINLSELKDRQDELSYFDATDVDYSLEINEKRGYATLRLTTFEYMSDNQQLAFENFLNNSFELLSKKNEIDALIVDLRENSGGDLYNCFLLFSYLSRRPFAEYKSVSSRIKMIPHTELLSEDFDSAKIKSINQKLETAFKATSFSNYSMYDSLINTWVPDKYGFTKKVFIITNWSVVSSASYFTLFVKNSGRGKVIGFETAGGNFSGNGLKLLEYALPGSQIRFSFPYANLKYSYAGPKPERGIIPDYIVPDTYESFKKNDDTQLNFVTDSLILKNK